MDNFRRQTTLSLSPMTNVGSTRACESMPKQDLNSSKFPREPCSYTVLGRFDLAPTKDTKNPKPPPPPPLRPAGLTCEFAEKDETEASERHFTAPAKPERKALKDSQREEEID
ncbi:hypothetical protein WMY93_028071 [Mugilogobius chulae]|uniref:Uncharacterized protein n=1 Tax=Mugilogobius chulae TaxID=88201 RepID=A0AAW0MUT0_9GOBI